MIKIGTSGWSYKEWEKVFYPDSKTPKLNFYSSYFGTVEIDSTFYRIPTKSMVFGWAKNAPEKFQFAAKLPQEITHKKKLDLSLGSELDLVQFLDLMRPLKQQDKLGPLLIQLPPSFDTSMKERLEEFLKIVPSKEYEFAIEFRNESWLEDESLNSLLRKYNIAKTVVDEPLLPVDLTATADFSFIRWHGKGKRLWYDYQYSDEELEPWVGNVSKVANNVKKIYGYFNNHFRADSVENALSLLNKMGMASDVQKNELAKIRAYKQGELIPY